jgi:hypothetical protein
VVVAKEVTVSLKEVGLAPSLDFQQIDKSYSPGFLSHLIINKVMRVMFFPNFKICNCFGIGTVKGKRGRFLLQKLLGKKKKRNCLVSCSSH